MDLTSNDGVEQKPKAIYLKDYSKPDYLVDELALEFELSAAKTIVGKIVEVKIVVNSKMYNNFFIVSR